MPALYVMHAPHYTMFRDIDGDGVADVRKDLADGFGPPAGVYGFNDHIVTGTRLGLDGRVYVSVGDKGVPKATGADGSTISLEGGGVISMRLDGTQLEIVSTGTRNHLDVAMDSLDNIFTYDNTDDGLGWYTRFTHHVPTGYYGYPYDYLTHAERHLPRISEHGNGSPVGAACYREAAWPAQYRDNAFHCEWGKGKIQRFITKPSGATFTAEIEDFMVREGNEEFRPLDLCFSPDGRYMYVADWNEGGWTNPKVCGRLFRVSYVGADAPAEPPRTADSAADRRSAQGPWPSGPQRADAGSVATGQSWASGRGARCGAAGRQGCRPGQGPCHLDVERPGRPGARFRPRGRLGQGLVRSGRSGPQSGCPRAGHPAVQVGPGAADQSIERSRRHRANVGGDRPGADRRAGGGAGAVRRARRAGRICPLRDGSSLASLGQLDAGAPGTGCAGESARQAAVLALTGVYDDRAVAELAWAVEHAQDPAVRARAAESIAEVHRQADPYREGWWGTQPARGKPARPKKNEWSGTPLVLATLRKALGSSDAGVRKAAIHALVEIKDADAIPLVAQLATDPAHPAALRADATRLLVTLKVPATADALARLLHDAQTPDDVLLVALGGAGELKSAAAAADVEQLLAHGQAAVRAKAIYALGQLAGQQATGPVIKALADADGGVRRQALQTAGEFELRDAVPAIVALAGNPELREDAIGALARMPDRRALAVYLDALADKNQALRTSARGALAVIRDAVGPDIIELARRNELPGPVRAELQAVFDRPAPLVTWQMVGPWEKPSEPKFDLTQAPDLAQPVEIAGKQVAWRKITTADPQGRMSLQPLFKPDANVWAMAYAAIETDREGASYFEVGRDDQLIVWVNGQKVYEFLEGGGWAPDQGHGPLPLRKGVNHIWVQAGNGGGPWEFSLAVNTRRPEYAFLYENVQPKFDTEVYRDFAAKTAGDAERGKAVFSDPQGVGCIKCHVVAGQGGKIGPDLSGIGAKYPREELVRSVLEPSIRVAEGFTVTTIVTDSGKIYAGILKTNAQDAVEVLDVEGKVTRIPTDEIEIRRTSYVSLMPNGLKDGMTLENFADVIAYLQSLK